MPVLQFKVQLHDDSFVIRKIHLDTSNTFQDFYSAILDAMNFDSKHPGVFYSTNKQRKKHRGVSTKEKKNISGAEYLSAAKTPVSALVESPDQRFIFEYQTPQRTWEWDIEMTGILPEFESGVRYPHLSDSQGLAPDQYRPEVMKDNELIPPEEEVIEEEDLSAMDNTDGES